MSIKKIAVSAAVVAALAKNGEAKAHNQCDGCAAGMPIDNGIHWHNGKPHMACTAHKYEKQDGYWESDTK